MKVRHKIDWDKVIDALKILNKELIPKYKSVAEKRKKYSEYVANYRAKYGRKENYERRKEYSKEYNKKYYKQHKKGI